MYEPSHFKVEDREQLHAVIRQHPLATLQEPAQEISRRASADSYYTSTYSSSSSNSQYLNI